MLVKHFPNVLWKTSENGNTIFISSNIKNIYGYSPEEIYKNGKDTWLNRIHPDDLQKVETSFKKLFDEGINFEVEYRIKRKDNKWIWLHDKANVVNEENGIRYSYGVFSDVTDKKKGEEELKESERKYKFLVDSSQEAIFIINKTGKILFTNPYSLKSTGYKEDEIIGKRINNFLTKDSLKLAFTSLVNEFKGKHLIDNIDLKIKAKNGEIRTFEISNKTTPIYENGKITKILVNAFDKTERKKSEETLIESENKYRTLVENSPDSIVSMDLKGNITSCNKAASNILGYSQEELLNKNFKKLSAIDKNDLPNFLNIFNMVFRGKKIDPVEIKITRKNGVKVYVETQISPIKKNKKIIGIQAITRDINNRKLAEEEFKKSEQKLSLHVKQTPLGVIEWNKDFTVDDWNPAAEQIFGYTKKEAFGRSAKDLILPNNVIEHVDDVWNKLLKNKGGTRSTNENITKEKKIITCEWYNTPLIDEKGKVIGVASLVQDISDQLKILEELKIANIEINELNKNLEKKVEERTNEIKELLKQKDEFINQLGHDLKNPIGPLLNLMPILEKNEENPERKEILDIMSCNIKYMKNLIVKTIELAQLKSPNSVLQCSSVNLTKEINEILEQNRMLLKEHDIEIYNNTIDRLQVEGDKLKIHEVFNNIIINAVNYTNEKSGKIIINQSQSDEDFITISIKDTGIGMNEEQLNKVFNEFYKADSSRHDFDSSGLGMAISKRIIEMHGGRIWVESEGLGKGSTFYFNLPFKQKDKPIDV